MPASTPGPAPQRSLWRDRDYVAWLAADTSWQFGASIRAFATLLITYAVTGSYAQAGAVSTVSTIVSAVAMLPGGVLVDRWDRRVSLTVSGLARALVYGAAALTWWTGAMTIGVLYAVGVASGLVAGLFSTASDAALKSVVPTRDLPRAIAANQGRDAAVSLSASPVSGVLMGLSYALPFAAATLGSLLQVIGTRFIRADLRPAREPDAASAHARRAFLRELGAGFSVYRDIPVLARMLPALILVNCGVNALFVGVQLILQGQGVEPWRIGLLDTAIGAGMLAGSVFAPRLIRRVPTGRLCVTLFVGCAAVLMPLSFAQDLPLALVVLALLGIMMPALNGAMGGYFQALIPNRLQGRALSAMQLVQQTLPALMPAAVGLGLQYLGAGATMLATAVLFPAAAVLVLTHRELRALPTPDRWDIGDQQAPGPLPDRDPAAGAGTVGA
jgi:MFS family permease